jgi:hypothetical protein
MTEQNPTTKHGDGIERMARRLWVMKCECYQWPQSAVTWERMTELGRETHRAQALSLPMEYQNER